MSVLTALYPSPNLLKYADYQSFLSSKTSFYLCENGSGLRDKWILSCFTCYQSEKPPDYQHYLIEPHVN